MKSQPIGDAPRHPPIRKAALVALVLLAACTYPEDVYRLEPVALDARPGLLDGTDSHKRTVGVAVDAKQRLIWGPRVMVRQVKGVDAQGVPTFEVQERQIVCAEPSPDALSTFSASVSGALRAELYAKGSVSGEFGQSISEAARVLGQRTATMQLLRDGYYRACEGFGNGLIDSFGYALILNKIDELMVELVAIEGLAQGQVKPDDQTKIKEAAMAEAKEGVDVAARDAARQADRSAQQDVQRLRAEERSAAVRKANLEAEKARSDAIVSAGTAATNALPAARNQSGELQTKITANDATIAEQDRIIANERAKLTPDEQVIEGAEQKKQTAVGERASQLEQKRTADSNVERLERQEARGRQEADDNAALAAQAASAATALTAATDARKTAETAATTARGNLGTAEQTAATSIADAEGKRALLGTIRPEVSPAAMNQILEIVRVAEKNDGTTTMKGACAIWFAQHPQIKLKRGTQGGSSLEFVDEHLPAIAHLCLRTLLHQSTASEGPGAEGPRPLVPSRGTRRTALGPSDALDLDDPMGVERF